jgi:alkaline phosphatase
MVEMAMRILGNDPAREFLLVAEEEGTDNFSNKNNAGGMLEALGRADRAIGKVLHYMDTHPFRNILLLVGSDSDAGHPGIWGPLEWDEDYLLPETSASGAELDGPDGQGGRPFWTKADQFGNRHPFGIAWGTVGDIPGSDVTKAHGYRSDLLKASIDNTDIYRILYEVLFRP